ncbi:MAG: hypothetical protein R3307_11040 [Anaerolineales bacterium]|nr:hypothetical protein [Anaerolineales bacterium]
MEKNEKSRRGRKKKNELKQDNSVPDLRLTGTSTLYDAQSGEPILVWEKTAAQNQKEIFEAAAQAFAQKIKPIRPIKLDKRRLDADLLCTYPVGDHHIGMLALAEETGGEDYNIEIAQELLLKSFAHLLGLSNAGHCLIPFLGDFLHFDGMKPLTPTSDNLLDTGTRFHVMVRTAIRCMRTIIESAARVHETVHVIVAAGNHDLAASIFLRECLANLYDNNPRIIVDTSPSHFHYHAFGKSLIGVHHGHGTKAKLKDLPLIMAVDCPDWSRCEHRYCYTGHVHSDNVFDIQGCRVESFRILAPGDAWATNSGYRSARDMKSILLHHEFGEVARHTVNPALLQGSGSGEPKTLM